MLALSDHSAGIMISMLKSVCKHLVYSLVAPSIPCPLHYPLPGIDHFTLGDEQNLLVDGGTNEGHNMEHSWSHKKHSQ